MNCVKKQQYLILNHVINVHSLIWIGIDLQDSYNLFNYLIYISTSYHPQTNGQIERWNSTLVTQITKYSNTDQNNWDTFLLSAVYAYNNDIDSSTRFSPYQLAFKRRSWYPFHPPASAFIFNKPHDYWKGVIQYRNAALNQAKENIIIISTRVIKNSL